MQTTAPTTTTYCTLARVGYWASLDAKCETEPLSPDENSDDILSHSVEFVLIGRHGDRLHLGTRLFTQHDDSSPACDENGDDFQSLDAAIRAHADKLLAITPMPGLRVAKPPRHDLWNGSVGTAFPETTPR